MSSSPSAPGVQERRCRGGCRGCRRPRPRPPAPARPRSGARRVATITGVRPSASWASIGRPSASEPLDAADVAIPGRLVESQVGGHGRSSSGFGRRARRRGRPSPGRSRRSRRACIAAPAIASCPPDPHVRPIMLRAMTTDARPRRNYLPADVPPDRPRAGRPAHDFEAPARERIHPAAWAYYAGGGVRRARRSRDTFAAWDAFRLRPRVLTDVVEHRPLDVDPRPAGRAARRDRARRRCTASRTATASSRPAARRDGRGRDPRRVDGREPHDRGRRRGGARRPALVPAVRPARPERDPRPRPAGRGRRLRGALPHGRPAGPRLPRRDPPDAVRPRRGRLREPPQARRLAFRWPPRRDDGHAQRGRSPGTRSTRSARGRRCRSCSRGS